MLHLPESSTASFPYRDFVYYYGPLAPALGGLVSFVANVGIWSAVGLGFAITLAILAATYGVARIVVDPLGAALATTIAAAVAFIPDNFSYVLPHTNDATLGTLLLLVLLIGIWRYACNATAARLVAVGSCVGLLALDQARACGRRSLRGRDLARRCGAGAVHRCGVKSHLSPPRRC